MKDQKSTVIVTGGSAQSVGFYQGDNADERKGIYISDYDTRSDEDAGMLIGNVIVTVGRADGDWFCHSDKDGPRGVYISDDDICSDGDAGILVRNETCSKPE